MRAHVPRPRPQSHGACGPIDYRIKTDKDCRVRSTRLIEPIEPIEPIEIRCWANVRSNVRNNEQKDRASIVIRTYALMDTPLTLSPNTKTNSTGSQASRRCFFDDQWRRPRQRA